MLLLPLIFSYIVYSFAYGIITSNTATINEVSLRQTEESMDRIFSELRSTGRQIITDEKVISLTWAPTPLTPTKLQKIGALQSELNKKSAYGSYISEIYVYFHNAEVAASTSGIVRQPAFEKALQEKFWIGLAEFEQLGAQGGSQFAVKLIRDPAKPEGAVQKVAVFVSDAVQRETPRATCMFVIDARHINDLLENYDVEDPASSRSVWAVAQDGSYLSPRSRGSIPAEVLDYCGEPDGIYYTAIDGEKSAVLSLRSPSTGWKLISVVSLENYRAQLRSIRNIYFIFLVFCLAAGVGISFYFTKRNYSPVRRMTNMFLSELEKDKKGGKKGAGDEFSLLESGLTRLLRENEDYERQIGHQKKDLRQMWLSRMLRGRVFSQKSFQTACEDYEIHFSGQDYLLIGITLQDFGNLFSRGEITAEEAFTMTNFIVTSIVEELLRPQFDVYVCSNGNALDFEEFSYGDTIYAIVNFDGKKTPVSEVTAQVLEQCGKAREFIKAHLHVAVKCYISGAYLGWEGIHSAFEETLWGMEQIESFQIDADIATRDEVQYRMFREPVSTERPEGGLRELCAAVSAGETERAWALYQEVLQEHIADLDQSFFYVRLYTFLILDRVSHHLQRDEGESRETARELRGARNLEELKGLVLQRFAQLAQQMPSQKDGAGVSLQVSEVVAYIDAHFTDPDLTVSALAEQFSVSQSYLLRVFKKNISTGVLEYISQRRVDEAKQLLKFSEATVNDVALQVGYANSLALIRAFKKLEGITPATYRKII
ncbi:MAG: helix-turn-helix domain-containing protein [Oscillospiraceae bacterium]|nr:helix-turn-helix domain-containing protein [Oscillospiraceae bacterium]